jgi:hypothetical protein
MSCLKAPTTILLVRKLSKILIKIYIKTTTQVVVFIYTFVISHKVTPMNKFTLLILLLLTLSSCNKKEALDEYDKNGNRIVYSVNVYAAMRTKNKNIKVTIIDTFCINQKKRALQDIKNGKLSYFVSPRLEFVEIAKQFNKYGIQTKKYYSSCIGFEGFNNSCYEEEMWKEIYKRYGKKLIDSLLETARKEFILNHPNVEYMEDGIDLRKKYKLK